MAQLVLLEEEASLDPLVLLDPPDLLETLVLTVSMELKVQLVFLV